MIIQEKYLSRKITYSVSWTNFIVCLLLLLEILANICIVIICFSIDDIINCEINLSQWPKIVSDLDRYACFIKRIWNLENIYIHICDLYFTSNQVFAYFTSFGLFHWESYTCGVPVFIIKTEKYTTNLCHSWKLQLFIMRVLNVSYNKDLWFA